MNWDKVKQIFFRIREFLGEARAELKKVTWPTRKQTLASTGVVLVVVFVMAIFLGLVDYGLAKIVKVLLS